MAIESRITNLPTKAPPIIIGGPTNYRWGSPEQPGIAVDWISSIQKAIERESLNAWVVVADESSDLVQPDVSALREKHLQALDQISHFAPSFLLIPETQTKVADMVVEKTGVEREIVDAILNRGGYANQRTKLDSAIGSLAIANRPVRFLSIDDDITIPQESRQVKEDRLPRGVRKLANSQVLFTYRGEENDLDMFDLEPNKLSEMFDDLGLTVAQIRQQMPDFRVTPHLHDTMQNALDTAVKDGFAQFQVIAPSGEDELPEADRAQIVAVQAIKSRKPDITAANQAKTHLLQEFPDEEQTIYAYPSGRSVKYGFGSADSNIDSGTLARLLNSQTAFWPWWFVSDPQISDRNPTHICTGQYRADNDTLVSILKRMYKRSGRLIKAIYEGGVSTQFLHNRVGAGYRQAMLEQAAASGMGKLPAYASMEKLVIHDGFVTIEPVSDNYEAPRDQAQRVYDLMHDLAMICVYKIQEIEGRKRFVEDSTADGKIKEYFNIIIKIYGKLAAFNQEEFFRHLDVEVRDQLRYYANILEAMPKVLGAVSEIIKEGRYPVVEIYKRE